MSEALRNLLDSIVAFGDDEAIGLPAGMASSPEHRKDAEMAVASVREGLGIHAESDYYKTSEIRFIKLVELALESIPPGSRLLDVGNAPGYLSQALFEAGFRIKGINLSREWDATYPSSDYLNRFDVSVFDVESGALPFADSSFDGVVFTEVLEHIAIRKPDEILGEFLRILRPGGVVVFSTPNVCNISNIIALLKGINIFWAPEIFYGSLDRHNREWTPKEVMELFGRVGFEQIQFFGINDHANWRRGTSDDVYRYLHTNKSDSALLRNTIVGVFRKPGIAGLNSPV